MVGRSKHHRYQAMTAGSQSQRERHADDGDHIKRALVFIVCGVSMFPFMNAAVKLLGAHYPVAQIVWARFTGHLLIMLLVFLPQYGRRLLATRRPAVQIGRSLLMLVSNMMFVVAITRVPLATASAIGLPRR